LRRFLVKKEKMQSALINEESLNLLVYTIIFVSLNITHNL
jgi:hypothetical protein